MLPRVEQQLNTMVDQIKEQIPIDEIILFGSYAYGMPESDSDIDLCFILYGNHEKKIDILRHIRRVIAPYANMPIDILVYYKDEFNDRANLTSTMEYKIRNEGVKLYEQ